MKKLLLAFAIIFTTSFAFGKKVDGFYITNSGDTVKATFVIRTILGEEPNVELLQKKVVYLDGAEKKQTFKPGEIKKFEFYLNDQLVEMESVQYKKKKMFLRNRVHGRMKVYDYFHFSFASIESPKRILLQKGEEPLVKIGGRRCRKELRAYMSDCPQVEAEIKDRVLPINDVKIFVEKYNGWCGKTSSL